MRSLTILSSALLAAFLLPLAASAQIEGDRESHRRAMAKLGFLVGDWSGDGSTLQRTGLIQLRQSEAVRYELDGTILVIEGTGRERSGSVVGDVAFNAYAIVS